MEDFYRILGVRADASSEEIKKAYKRVSRAYHPDSGASDDGMMKAVNEAYKVLTDPVKRAAYNRSTAGRNRTSADRGTSGPEREKQEKAIYEEILRMVKEKIYGSAAEFQKKGTEQAMSVAAVLFGIIRDWKDADSRKAICQNAVRAFEEKRRQQEADRKKEAEEREKHWQRENERLKQEKQQNEEEFSRLKESCKAVSYDLQKKKMELKCALCVCAGIVLVCFTGLGSMMYSGNSEHSTGFVSEESATAAEQRKTAGAEAAETVAEEEEGTEEICYVVTSRNGVHVRMAADRGCVLGVLPQGTVVWKSGEYWESGWIRFEYRGYDAVAYARYFSREG